MTNPQATADHGYLSHRQILVVLAGLLAGRVVVAHNWPFDAMHLRAEFARIGKAVSSPRRLDLLDLLSQGEMDVETLAVRSGLTVKNTSAHLRTLRESRLVETIQRLIGGPA